MKHPEATKFMHFSLASGGFEEAASHAISMYRGFNSEFDERLLNS